MPTPSTQRASAWSVTINNPTEDDFENINLARQKGWQIIGQLELGKNGGTRHYQLMAKTPQVRFSAVKKAFPRAHIEVARNVSALEAYVHKEDTRAGELPTEQEQYPSLVRYWELVTRFFDNPNEFHCLDQMAWSDENVRFLREVSEDMFRAKPLALLDLATRSLIKRGYMVEGIATNPATRQAWKLFGREILHRSLRAITQQQNASCEAEHMAEASETDGQTDSVQSAQEVVVPMDITDAPQVYEEDGPPSSPGSAPSSRSSS